MRAAVALSVTSIRSASSTAWTTIPRQGERLEHVGIQRRQQLGCRRHLRYIRTGRTCCQEFKNIFAYANTAGSILEIRSGTWGFQSMGRVAM
ncbi:MAG: hypothetical protein ABSG32_11695 [Terriglobia bacterium]|jgi:hypothetical protein